MIVVSWLIVSSSGTKNFDLSSKLKLLSLRARSIMICKNNNYLDDDYSH